MIARDLDRADWESPPGVVRSNLEFDPGVHANPESDVYPFEVENPGWSIVGVARVVGDEEELFELRRSSVWLEIDGASGLDPPNPQPPDSPRRRTTKTPFRSY